MKRRAFFGMPLAMAGMGLAVTGRSALAASIASSKNEPLQALLLRLDGSDGSEADILLDGRRWTSEFSPSAGSARQAKVMVHGMVRAAGSSLGNVTVESVFFGSRGGVNTALVYLSANDAFGPRSKAMGFHADASAFGGFQLTPQKAGAGACLCTVGDNSTGAMRPGLYAVLVGSGRLPRAEDFMFSGYVDRPLVALSGRAPSVDYLAFGISA